MRRLTCLLTPLLALTAAAASAQQRQPPSSPEEVARQVLPSAAQPSAAELQKQLLAHTKSLFAAFRDRDLMGFLQGVTADFTYAGPEGVLTTEDLAATVQGCSLRSFSVLEPQLRQLTPDTAVLLYRHRQDATCNGRRKPAELTGTDVYVRKGGRWLISVHTETAPE